MIQQDDVNAILGYGKVLRTLIGIYDTDEGEYKKGDKKYKDYHVTSVSLDKIPELFDKADAFLGNKYKFGSTEFLDNACDIIKLGLLKMHPNVTIEQIKKDFDLNGIVDAIEIVMSINDFFQKMSGIVNKVQQTNKLADSLQQKDKSK